MPLSAAALQKRIEGVDVVRTVGSHPWAGPVFLVGGAIRELALGGAPKDYDFALARPEDLRAMEEAFGAPSFLLGKKPLQTHRIVTGDLVLDITLLDRSIGEDLGRRDFTINAVAYDIGDGRLIDPFDGLADMEKRIIRYPRAASLDEDPLRMVKAMRHLAALRGFSLDPALKEALAEKKGLIGRTAAERVKYEVDLIMLSRSPHRAIKAMKETGLLFEVFPELLPLGEMDRARRLRPKALGHTLGGFRHVGKIGRFYPFTERERRLACYGLLFHDLGKPRTFSYDEEKGRVHFYYHERHSRAMASEIMERLRFSSSEARAVLAIVEHHMRVFLISNPEATEKATRRLVYRMEDLVPALVFLTLLDLYGNSGGRENQSTEMVKARCRSCSTGTRNGRAGPSPPSSRETTSSPSASARDRSSAGCWPRYGKNRSPAR